MAKAVSFTCFRDPDGKGYMTEDVDSYEEAERWLRSVEGDGSDAYVVSRIEGDGDYGVSPYALGYSRGVFSAMSDLDRYERGRSIRERELSLLNDENGVYVGVEGSSIHDEVIRHVGFDLDAAHDWLKAHDPSDGREYRFYCLKPGGFTGAFYLLPDGRVVNRDKMRAIKRRRELGLE